MKKIIGSLIGITLLGVTIKVFVINQYVLQTQKIQPSAERHKSTTGVVGDENVVQSGNSNVAGSHNVFGSHNTTNNYYSTDARATTIKSLHGQQSATVKPAEHSASNTTFTHRASNQLKGWITLKNEGKKEFDELWTTTKLPHDSTKLEIYPRDSADGKPTLIDLKNIASITFGKSPSENYSSFIEVNVQFKNGEYKQIVVGQRNKLITAHAGTETEIDYYRIEKIEFN